MHATRAPVLQSAHPMGGRGSLATLSLAAFFSSEDPDVTAIAEIDAGDELITQVIPIKNVDAVKLQFIDVMNGRIDPRIPGLQFHKVDGFSLGPVLIVRIPRSWSGPHMANFRDPDGNTLMLHNRYAPKDAHPGETIPED